MMRRFALSALLLLSASAAAHAQPLADTKPLDIQGDLARHMLDGIDRYLSRELAASVDKRKAYWKPDYSSRLAYLKSVEPNRERLKKILGVVDARVPVTMEYVTATELPSLVGEGKNFKAHAVRWTVLPGVHGEGLLLEPNGRPKACIVAIPDADQTPEMLAGLAKGLPPEGQFARLLAEAGNRVVIPTIIDRQDTWSGSDKLKRFTNQTHREFIYRMAYQMGRHVIGYEVQRVLAAVDWFLKDKERSPIGVYGYGEGGLIALYAAALDTRIDSTVVSGHFGPREGLHNEPIYRNVWSLLKEFGDGEVMQLIVPRYLLVEEAAFKTGAPPAPRAGRGGAAPGIAMAPPAKNALQEIKRITKLFPKYEAQLSSPQRTVPEYKAVGEFLRDIGEEPANEALTPVKPLRLHDPSNRQRRQFTELVDYTQKLLPDATPRRQQSFWSKLDTSSLDKFKKSQEPLREYFHDHIIGRLPEPKMPLNPRTRLLHDTPKWKAYEVVLDVYDDVISYGILCVPTDLKPGEKRPVVVCQHGLEGRPTDVVEPNKKTQYYNSFGSQLADKGFIVFAPQNPYIFKNDFRQVVRKANPLELSLYSFIVRQHQRILEFLGTLPFVDVQKIAYYGLSYGGKVAMRIPAILEGYCLSICSGDFNEWIWKNINLDWVGSYMFTGEYEMYEFDLGNTFNYAEMAALIAPRPFMVERGHSDGVGLDEYVAFEYAKVRRLYAQLRIPERTEIEFFTGGHEINLRGTLAFLQKHLEWPPR
jgi:dienelactone hydrolase